MDAKELVRSQYFADLTGIITEGEGERSMKATGPLEFEFQVKFSVPEFYAEDLVSEGKPVNRDEVIHEYKDMVTKFIVQTWKEVYGFDDDDATSMLKYVKFLCRVRKGETWTKEMGEAAMAKTTAKLKEAARKQKEQEEYSEV